MSRLILIHWNAKEAAQRAERLRRAGHQVRFPALESGIDLPALAKDPPDAFVIDLGRIPSQGRDVAIWLRQRKATRGVPIVFVAGDPDKIARVRKLLPDAEFTEWRRIRGALNRAIRHAPAKPVVPGTMAGYSGAPLVKKLGIHNGSVVTLLGAPTGFERKLGALPEDVRIRKQARGSADLIVLFVKTRAALNRRLPVAKRHLAEGGALWIAWPKAASGVSTDLDQRTVRALGLRARLVDYKICAIDETWSGLRFARRRQKRGS